MGIAVGHRASRSATLTAEHVQAYAAMTGDHNPLHFDEAFVEKTRFGRLVVQGGLTTGILHALVAMDMPGPGTVFLSQDWKFTAPVFVGDTIKAEAEVLEVHEKKPVCKLAIRGFVSRVVMSTTFVESSNASFALKVLAMSASV